MKRLIYLIALSGLIFASCAKSENNPNKEQKYPISIQAAREANDDPSMTRIELINDQLYWSVGDRVGLFAGRYQQYDNYLLLNNFPLTNVNESPVKNTTFKGVLTRQEIGQFNSRDMYTYTSYYPYDQRVYFEHVDGYSSDIFIIEMPYAMEFTPNKFPHQYAFMWSRNWGLPAITHLMNEEQQHVSDLSFFYEHVFSYLCLKIGKNPEGKGIVRINIKSATTISGRYYLSIRFYGELSPYYADDDINKTRQIYIPEGLYESNEIYIPMVPATYNGNMEFEFIYDDQTSITKTINNLFQLERGKIHPVTFNLDYPTTSSDSYGDTLDDFEDGYNLGSF